MPCPTGFGFGLYPFCSLQTNTQKFHFKTAAMHKGKEASGRAAREHTGASLQYSARQETGVLHQGNPARLCLALLVDRFNFMCTWILSTCVHGSPYACLLSGEVRKWHWSPGIRGRDSCELAYGSKNQVLCQEQVLLITEPFL